MLFVTYQPRPCPKKYQIHAPVDIKCSYYANIIKNRKNKIPHLWGIYAVFSLIYLKKISPTG